jgi:heme/copper-type cytochrome/quinol oxidase subunit 3
VSDVALTVDVGRSRSTAWWGMILLIATEATLFAVLLLSYLYLRFESTPAWPPPPIEPPTLKLPVLMTVLLVVSSIPMQLAANAARARRTSLVVRVWLLIGSALGLAFLAVQFDEYQTKLGEFRPSTNSYGSLFYTITGFHGIHVIVGLLLTLWAVVLAGRRVRRGGERAIENVVLYWHFVGVVWLAVFATIYLSGAL